LACEPRKLRRGDCAADSGLNPHPIPGWFLERKGAGEASVWVRARVRDRAGPCASPGWSGATGNGKRSSRSGRSGAEELGAGRKKGRGDGGTNRRARLVNRRRARVLLGRAGGGVAGWTQEQEEGRGAGLGRREGGVNGLADWAASGREPGWFGLNRTRLKAGFGLVWVLLFLWFSFSFSFSNLLKSN